MKKSQGFAISGVLYPILVLVIFLIVQILSILGTRKVVLDQNSNRLLETINGENKVYTNEELSSLLQSQQKQIEALQASNSICINNCVRGKKEFHIEHDKINTKKLVVKIEGIQREEGVRVKMMGYGNYHTINFGGYFDYDYASSISSNTDHGAAVHLEKGGGLETLLTSIDKKIEEGPILYFTLNFSSSHSTGSYLDLYIQVLQYHNPDIGRIKVTTYLE